jgi:serine/threonine-protein kinase PknK
VDAELQAKRGQTQSDLAETAHEVGGGPVSELAEAGFGGAVEVGHGGFGVVFRCVQVRLARVVAVKLLTIDFADERARFVREQRAMGQLTGHPNIVALLQVGQTAQGLPFLVMPFCAQGSWQQRIAGLGILPEDEVLRVGVKIAGALESAHRMGIVHRDVKPANILFTEYGEPALGDFGIARTAAGFKTATGVFVGSPAYTAPEILSGEAPSPASDVYGLGASLFSALTGHVAFQRHAGEQIMAQFVRITTEPVPDLRERGIADDVAAVVEQAMARNPTDRPSAQELGQQLQQLQARHGVAVDEMALYGTDGAEQGLLRPITVGRRARTGRVPALPVAMVGRGAELAQLRELLTESRMVTLTGTGGVGKTTLATHAAHELHAQFPDGVWFIPLADLREGSLLTEVVTAGLGVRDQAGRALTDVLIDFLAPRQALVVLDNCDQIIDDAAKLVDILLHHCPQLHIVATSREILDIGGEALLALTPLSCPDPDADPTLRTLAGYDAVELFIQRARAAVPNFTLTADKAAAVARICARLDGLPLALELAAARLRALSVEQIADGLAENHTLLARGRRGAATRLQSLTGCIDWSYQLCSQAEQQLWQQLSVFAGSFDLPAARHVSTDDPSVTGDRHAGQYLDLLSALVDKSIVIRTEDQGAVRFRLLDTLRDYGRTHLTDTAHHALRRRHATHYEHLLDHASAEWLGPQQVSWLQRLTWELPNIREVLQFNLADFPARALPMAPMMIRIWIPRGMLSEARRWLDLVLSATPPHPTPQRIHALYAAAEIAAFQGDLAAAQIWIAEARQHLSVVIDDPLAHGRIDYVDGHAAMLAGELARAQDCFQRAIAITDDYQVQVVSMGFIGWIHQNSRAADEAMKWFEQALALGESLGEVLHRTSSLLSVGVGCWRRGELQRAEQLLQECLQLCQLTRDKGTGANCLEAFAWFAESHQDPRRAAVLMAAASTVSRTTGVFLFGATRLHRECERRSREALGAAEFDTAWSKGESLSFDEAAAIALSETADEHDTPNMAGGSQSRDSTQGLTLIDRG